MLRSILLGSLLMVGAYAVAPIDTNCTTGGTAPAYNDKAFNCDNKISDSACKVLFATDLAVGGTTERNANCFQVSAAPDENQKQAAIAMCPKQCGYCCQTPEYTCRNAEYPRTVCEKVTPAQCKDPQWREILAADCPNVCGFCLEGGCVDAVIECANDVSICRNIDMQSFVKTNCKKTCGYCTNSGFGTTMSPNGGTCVDQGTSCPSWKKNGFCSSTYYTETQKRQYCAASCNLCY